MANNHYITKPTHRNRPGKRKDTKRIAANMAKIKQLEQAEIRAESVSSSIHDMVLAGPQTRRQYYVTYQTT